MLANHRTAPGSDAKGDWILTGLPRFVLHDSSRRLDGFGSSLRASRGKRGL